MRTGRSKNITDEERAKIVEMMNTGMSVRELCNATGRHRNTMYLIAKEEGIDMSSRITEEEQKQICKDWEAGMKLNQLSQKYNRSLWIVREALDKFSDYKPKQLAKPKKPIELLPDNQVMKVEKVKKFKPEYVCSAIVRNRKVDYYDITDVYVDRPNICKPPQWKYEFQEQGKMYFGKEYGKGAWEYGIDEG